MRVRGRAHRHVLGRQTWNTGRKHAACSSHTGVNMCMGMCVDMCADMCVVKCAHTCVHMNVNMCADMCAETCGDVSVDMCGHVCIHVRRHVCGHGRRQACLGGMFVDLRHILDWKDTGTALDWKDTGGMSVDLRHYMLDWWDVRHVAEACS